MGRAVSSVVGVILLISLVVVGAGTMSLALATEPPDPAPVSSFELAVDADTDELSITHRGGESIDLTEATIRITIDGKRVTHQPPVPFFAARGFESGPGGPFNSASDNTWRPGETGTLELASTNSPALTPDSIVTVRIITDGTEIARLSTSG
ncbi:type IV pilin [Halovenus halobia]|uniref:type IV pilin n=1 Tax=Halovenus halobia TaxID=3396622 RepID=UPI003F5470F5